MAQIKAKRAKYHKCVAIGRRICGFFIIFKKKEK